MVFETINHNTHSVLDDICDDGAILQKGLQQIERRVRVFLGVYGLLNDSSDLTELDGYALGSLSEEGLKSINKHV